MIATAHYVICDDCGDPAEVSTEGVKTARAYAKDQGYARRYLNGKLMDFCPRCHRRDPETDVVYFRWEWETDRARP